MRMLTFMVITRCPAGCQAGSPGELIGLMTVNAYNTAAHCILQHCCYIERQLQLRTDNGQRAALQKPVACALLQQHYQRLNPVLCIQCACYQPRPHPRCCAVRVHALLHTGKVSSGGQVPTLFLYQHGTATCQQGDAHAATASSVQICTAAAAAATVAAPGRVHVQTLFWPSLLTGPYVHFRGALVAGALEAAVGGPGLYLPSVHVPAQQIIPSVLTQHNRLLSHVQYLTQSVLTQRKDNPLHAAAHGFSAAAWVPAKCERTQFSSTPSAWSSSCMAPLNAPIDVWPFATRRGCLT